MSVQVAVAKRRAKRLAGAAVQKTEPLGWMLVLYSIVDSQLAPFSMKCFSTRDEAFAEAKDTLKVNDADWNEVLEEDVEQFILENSNNCWSPTKYAKRGGLGGAGNAP